MSRSRFSQRSFVIGLMLTVILGATVTLAVIAQGPDNGEPASLAPKAAKVVEDKLTIAPAPSAQEQGGVGSGEVGSTPNSTTVVKELELLAEPASPDASWFRFYTANTFVPYDDDMTYNYSGAGCTYRTGGTAYTEHDLQLPQGAEIDYLRIYYYDNDATNDAHAYLFAYDGAGGSTQIASVGSSGTPGQSSTGSGFFFYFVDNVGAGLSLRLNYENGSNSNLRICGVRLRYQYNISTVSLPLILNTTNP